MKSKWFRCSSECVGDSPTNHLSVAKLRLAGCLRRRMPCGRWIKLRELCAWLPAPPRSSKWSNPVNVSSKSVNKCKTHLFGHVTRERRLGGGVLDQNFWSQARWTSDSAWISEFHEFEGRLAAGRCKLDSSHWNRWLLAIHECSLWNCDGQNCCGTITLNPWKFDEYKPKKIEWSFIKKNCLQNSRSCSSQKATITDHVFYFQLKPGFVGFRKVA